MNIYEYLRLKGNIPQAPGLGVTGIQLPQAPMAATMSGPLAPPQAPPPKGRGFLGAIDDVFGGPDMKNLTPEQQKAARRKGLLAFGAQMLTATDPRGNRAQGLSALGQGVMAAQGGYGQGIEQGMAQNQAQQRTAMYAALAPLPGEGTEQRYSRYLRMLDTAVLNQDKNAMTAISQALNTMPKPGEGTADVSWQNVTDAQGNLVQLNPKTGATRPVMGSDGKPFKAYRGTSPGGPVNWQTVTGSDGALVQVNPRTGETRPVVDSQGSPVMGQRKPLTEAETKGATFYNLALQSSDAMDSPELSTPQSPGSRVAAGIPYVGNAFRSSADQQRAQVAQQFINAILRRESGAAVPDTEYPKYEAVYIPVYGDSPETLARKAKARKTAIQSLKLSAGRALDASPPDGVANEFADVEAAFQ